MSYKRILVIAIAALGFASCRPDVPVPKKIGYYRIDLPEHNYRKFDSAGYPFSFEYPVYGKLANDVDLNKGDNVSYWLNVNFPELDATIYLSYKEITPQEPLSKMVEQSYKLTYAHDKRADYIKTPEFKTTSGLTGVFYNVGGNAASPYQFFITDGSRNFIRGALYFNTTPNADSLRPASDFLKKDMEYMLETIQFRK